MNLFTTVFLGLLFWTWADVGATSIKRVDSNGLASFIGEFDPPQRPPPPDIEPGSEYEDDDEYGEEYERSVVEAHKYVREVTSSYNYSEVLEKSILFYEAQRSGPLPSTNRVSFRGNSAMDDSGHYGEDLTGGYYDAGDHVKFGFPAAFTTTALAWGVVRFKDAYIAAGQLWNMYETIKWATDYFIKAHVAPMEFYSQVGYGSIDHQYWGAPEWMTMERPPIMVNPENPGTEVAAETAAALAAASILFDGVTEYSGYSELCLVHAYDLFELAYRYQGSYQSGGYYSSSNYNDELCWAASWIYYASNNVTYKDIATTHYDLYCRPRGWAFAWGNKNAGVQTLLYQLVGGNKYLKKIKASVDNWLPNVSLPYTNKGLVYRNEWGPLRYAAGTTMIAVIAADMDVNKDTYIQWAKSQIHYMLGDAGRSYLVGFGNNSPVKPHHRASSCNATLTGSSALTSPDPNPNLLVGALVGGPDIHDNYTDNRQDYVMNEVACDYNAAFQTTVAGLLHFELQASRK